MTVSLLMVLIFSSSLIEDTRQIKISVIIIFLTAMDFNLAKK
jgi:hypothetical protein